MPTAAQQTAIAGAIEAIRSAEMLLTTQIRATDDTLTAIKLTHEYNNLDSFLSSLLHLQNAADDSTFSSATKAAQTTCDSLKADQATLNKIVSDAAIAGKIVAAIGKALAFVSKL